MTRRLGRWLAACVMLAMGWAHAASVEVQTPLDARRGLDQTLLTYPEWFLVFSPNEYGEYLAHGVKGGPAPSEFPFYGHIRQFWQGYARVAGEIRERKLPANPGYHLMILVIGTSTTVEYALKSAYESLIGRMTETRPEEATPEDRYAAAVAQDYVRFIRVRPWYEYDFGKKLQGLWQDTLLWGANPVRKWERKYALTTEYLIKMVYAKLIGLGTAGVYDPALPTTVVVLHEAPKADAALPDMQTMKALDQGAALVSLPRYEAFTHYAQALAEQGNGFTEIAGNTSFILVSVLTHGDWSVPKDVGELYAQPILTVPGQTRHLLVLPVAQLADQLRAWKGKDLVVEHIFDY